MAEFGQFVQEQWLLCSALLVTLMVYGVYEWRQRCIGPQRLNAQQLSMLVSRENGHIIDVRDKAKFDNGHILGAINIPRTRLDKEMERYKKWSEKPLVVVCEVGHVAPATAGELQKKGFTQVSVLRGGMNAWRADSLPLAQ